MLFAWNPLVLLQGPGHAHNDLLMITVAALAFVLWEKRRWWAAAVIVLALAAAIKIPVLLLGPLLLVSILRRQPSWSRRVLVFGAATLLGATTLLLAFVPYWPPWESLAGLPRLFASQRTYAIVSLVWLGLAKLQWENPTPMRRVWLGC